jgi:hypothetical protein
MIIANVPSFMIDLLATAGAYHGVKLAMRDRHY